MRIWDSDPNALCEGLSTGWKSPTSSDDIQLEDIFDNGNFRKKLFCHASKFLESDGGQLLPENTKGLLGRSGKEGKTYRK